MISCVILTYNSHVDKGFCLRHCLKSVFGQDLRDFEVVIIENSRVKLNDDTLIPKLIAEENARREHPVSVRFVDSPVSLEVGPARNAAVRESSGDVVVFIDDDTVILQDDALSRIERLSAGADFGFGAVRLWSRPLGWFEREADGVLAAMAAHDDGWLVDHAGNPPPEIIMASAANASLSADVVTTTTEPQPYALPYALPYAPYEAYRSVASRSVPPLLPLMRTYISNFGFCRRDLFDEVGGYPSFKGWGLEDDTLMLRLMVKSPRFARLDGISVLHVSHQMGRSSTSNAEAFADELRRLGVAGFNAPLLFLDPPPTRDEIFFGK